MRKPEFKKIWRLAIPFLQKCRPGDLLHTVVAIRHLEEIIQGEGEGIDEDILMPAIILHDIGWSRCPEELVKNFFTDVKDADTKKELRIQHMEVGAILSRDVLEQVHWDHTKIKKIVSIIAKHDIPDQMTSPMDKIVFDADFSWRYSSEGFYLDLSRFVKDTNFTPEEAIKRLERDKDKLKTVTGKKIALRELSTRKREILIL
ncbi:HD domain protein [Candidatus Vecturithrix granuli]|uniref:HD domain protein n=1 Tax=Vecturithrix granuli TaxID=1499967 RepID=A0A081BWR5_VECG1|nr:HD domain protein [Candidatus Vecturithrix granuli]